MIVAVVENGALYFTRTDHIGRPVFTTDLSGATIWEASYLPFGGVHTVSGTPINLRFPGQWFQSESGLHQNWMRDYDPTLGPYIQAYPLGLVDGASVYGYALQNPGRYVDPRGESVLDTLCDSMIFGWTGTCKKQPVCTGDGITINSDDPQFLPPPSVTCEDCAANTNNEGQPPYAGATPDDRPDDFRPVRGGGRENINDGSYWDRDNAGHGGSTWKRWPSLKTEIGTVTGIESRFAQMDQLDDR